VVEQVADGGLGEVVRPDVLGRQALGIEQGGDGFAGMAALDVGAGDVDEQSGLAFG
jgi:hypothetical protein